MNRKAIRSQSIIVIILIIGMCCGIGLAQDGANDGTSIGPRVGSWMVRMGGDGPGAITYEGGTIAQYARVVGFQERYAGTRFAMDGAERAETENSVTWTKNVPGNQGATLSVKLSPEKCHVGLDTMMYAAGPTEYAIRILEEAVRTSDKHCFAYINGKAQSLNLLNGFAAIGGINEIRFEQPERTIIVRCENCMLQDRRARGGDLYLVRVMGASGKEPVSARTFFEFEVVEAAPADVEKRRAMLGQVALEKMEVGVPNGSFEDGLAGWTHGPMGTVDREVKHSGAQSAKIVIADPEKDANSVYLTQQVPISEDALYDVDIYVKTENVTAAMIGGKTPTGATVIVEFADSNHKWYAGGKYATGLYGTNDWKKLTIEQVKAPKGARYAEIFVALRGLGTAWFDDISMREVRHHVMLRGPEYGEALADNTPTFDWSYEPGGQATIELSRDADFAHVERMAEGIQFPPYSLAEPIAPGTWYWRVRIPNARMASPVWRFEQTAELVEDCTDPTITVKHQFLETADRLAIVRFSDNIGVVKVRLSVDDKDVTAKATVRPRKVEYRPAGGWSDGLHTLKVYVEDAAGNSAQENVYFTRASNVPKTEWAMTGGVTVDGEKQFLIGMYGVEIVDMPQIAELGIDFVHKYTWDSSGSVESALEYLDAAQENGLKVYMGLWRQALIAGDEDFVAQRVGALMNHPALFAWYLFDEPDLSHQYVSPEDLTGWYQLIKRMDPFHPVIVSVAGDSAVGDYRNALDVHWTQVYGSTAQVAGRIETHRALLGGDKPVMEILGFYDRQQSAIVKDGGTADPAKITPNARKLRADMYMALAHNSSGLNWWWWAKQYSSFYTVADVPEVLSAFAGWLREIDALRPVLEADGEIATWIETPAEGIEVHFWEKKLADRTVIIAVNRDEVACETMVRPKLSPKQGTVRVRFEDRAVEMSGGVFPEEFEPLGVHVYEMDAE